LSLALLPLLLGGAQLACVGQTGGTAVDFPVMAAGPATATAGEPLACANDGPWTIALSQASLHIGAVYLNQSQPVSGGQATDCYLPGTYVGQELSAIDVDLLSPTLAPFPTLAHGITEPPALVGQVWLTHGDVNTIPDPEPVLRVAGTASRAGAELTFAAEISIGSNRQGRGPSGGVAGGDPICKERIVTPIPAPITIAPSGSLILRVDPCRLFTNVDFGQLSPGPTPGTYAFSDDPTAPAYTQPSTNLYSNLRNIGPYAFSWAPDL
jgi:hypothetical protein